MILYVQTVFSQQIPHITILNGGLVYITLRNGDNVYFKVFVLTEQ